VKKYKSKLISVIVILIVFGVGYSFVELGDSEDWENQMVVKDVNRVLASQNQKEINVLAADQATSNFLLKIGKDTKCKNTSGFQGLEPNGWHAYVTVIENRTVELSIEPEKKSNLFDYIFPKYKLRKMSMR
jgi:hypothetical protein